MAGLLATSQLLCRAEIKKNVHWRFFATFISICNNVPKIKMKRFYKTLFFFSVKFQLKYFSPTAAALKNL